MRFRFLAQRSDRPLQQHLQLGVRRGEVLDVTGERKGTISMCPGLYGNLFSTT